MKKYLIIILIGALFSFNNHYRTGDDGIINAQIKKPIKVLDYRYNKKFGDYKEYLYRQTIYGYDLKNNLISINENDDNFSSLSYNDGLLKEKQLLDSNGNLRYAYGGCIVKYKYDFNNNIISEIGYDNSGREELNKAYKYEYDSNAPFNLIKEQYYYNKKLRRVFYYKYDSRNRLIVKDGYEVERDGGEYPDLLMEFKYDENNNLIKEIHTKREHSVRKKTIYYEYDSKNNLVIKKCFDAFKGDWQIDYSYNNNLLIKEVLYYYEEDDYGEKVKYPEYKLEYRYN